MYQTTHAGFPYSYKYSSLRFIETEFGNKIYKRKRYVTPQICCIKVLLKSIFGGYLLTEQSLNQKGNWWSVCILVSNGAMKLTFLHLNPKSV